MSIHALMVTAEVAPLSGSGDLSEIASNIPPALRELGIDVTVVTPLYRDISPERHGLARRLTKLSVQLGSETADVDLLEGKLGSSDVKVYLVGHSPTFGQTDSTSAGSLDYRQCYLLAEATRQLAAAHDIKPDIVHAYDWQTGFLPLLMAHSPDSGPLSAAKTVFTVANPAQTGCFAPHGLADLGLGYELFHPEGIEFYGQVSLLKAGILPANAITVPSPTTAQEVQQEGFGGGLHGLYASRTDRLTGIPCGLDYATWNPATNRQIAATYDGDTLEGKTTCRRALLQELGMRGVSNAPLLVMLGPFDEASGIDIVVDSAEEWIGYNMQLAFVGSADAASATRIEKLAGEARGKVAFHRDAPEGFVKRAMAGADATLLVPESDPSGLTQCKALSLGTIPVVYATGGLRDTVVDFDPRSQTGTGFVLEQASAPAFTTALQRLLSTYSEEAQWHAIRQNALRQRFGWKTAALRYEQVYRQALR